MRTLAAEQLGRSSWMMAMSFCLRLGGHRGQGQHQRSLTEIGSQWSAGRWGDFGGGVSGCSEISS